MKHCAMPHQTLTLSSTLGNTNTSVVISLASINMDSNTSSHNNQPAHMARGMARRMVRYTASPTIVVTGVKVTAGTAHCMTPTATHSMSVVRMPTYSFPRHHHVQLC